MYFFDSLNYPFGSEKFVSKLLMGMALLFIPIFNFFGIFVIMGYGIKIMQATMRGERNLPEFELGSDAVRGLKMFGGIFLLVLPILILSFIVGLIFNDGQGNLTLFGNLISILISLIWTPIQLVAMAKFAVSEKIGSFFEFGDIIDTISNHLGDVAALYINLIAFGVIAGIGVFMGFLLLIIPGLILMIVALYAQSHLYAQFAMRVGIGNRKAKPKNDDFAF